MNNTKLNFVSKVNDSYNEMYKGVSAWRDLGGYYKAEHVIKLCSDNGIKPRNILEVGCGEGSILYHLDRQSFCPTMHGLEISASGVKITRQRDIPSLVSVDWFDGYQIPYPDKCFDLVILSHVLEHVEYERLLLRELKRVARYQIIEVPLDYSLSIDKKYQHFLSYGHINIYNPPLVRFLLKTEGFEIVDDLPDITGKEVIKYKTFEIEKQSKTEDSLDILEEKLSTERESFHSLSKSDREQKAHDYSILCSSGARELKILENNN